MKKKSKLLFLGVLCSQLAYSQTGTKCYMYTYDGAGNIISRVKATPRNKPKAMFDLDDLTNYSKQSGLIHIKPNTSWSAVQIEIDGNVKNGDMLSIFTDKGLYVTSFKLESNKVTLNLSKLKKGTYLFRYNRDKNVTESKIVKTY